MRKLKLEIDTLEVDSFDTDGNPSSAIGTVRGRESGSCGVETCTDGPDCDWTMNPYDGDCHALSLAGPSCQPDYCAT